MLKIRDLVFEIDTAILDTFIDEEEMILNWGLEIRTINKGIDGYDWKPTVRSEIFLKTQPNDLKHWKEVQDQKISWQEAFDKEEEPYGMLYVFGHEPIYESSILLSQQKETTGNLSLQWDAKCKKQLSLFFSVEDFQFKVVDGVSLFEPIALKR